jgi:ubiquinone/menaquinone biosynthesis C-methylase UbiE
MISDADEPAAQTELSVDLDEYYSTAYSNIASAGAFGFASRLQHRQMENHELIRSTSMESVLEVGAGSGQHIYFVSPNQYTEYIQTDLRPPIPSNQSHGIWIDESVEATSLPFEDAKFDRLIATCVLAHTADPPVALKEWRRVVRPGGIITMYLPTESSLLLELLRRFGPKQARIKAGFDPRIIHLDHRYNYKYLRTAVELEFGKDHLVISRFPRFMPWWLSLWEIIHVRT